MTASNTLLPYLETSFSFLQRFHDHQNMLSVIHHIFPAMSRIPRKLSSTIEYCLQTYFIPATVTHTELHTNLSLIDQNFNPTSRLFIFEHRSSTRYQLRKNKKILLRYTYNRSISLIKLSNTHHPPIRPSSTQSRSLSHGKPLSRLLHISTTPILGTRLPLVSNRSTNSSSSRLSRRPLQ